jgi:hypothetical protein
MKTSRRDALRSLALLGSTLVAFPFLSLGCAAPSDDGDAPGAGEGEGGDGAAEADLVTCKPPVISANHGHALVVPPADVTAGAPKTYSIQGSSAHPHAVTVTAAHFAQLAAGTSITLTSTNVAGHAHQVTVSCTVTANPPPPAACGNGARAIAISANHGHALVVSKADVTSGTPKTYAIKGTSSHTHSVTLTATHFATLASGKSIDVSSTNDAGHAHKVTIRCA